MRVEIVLTGLFQSLAPKVVEVIGTLCGGHELLGVKGRCAQSVVVFTVDVCRDLDAIEAGLVSFPLRRIVPSLSVTPFLCI